MNMFKNYLSFFMFVVCFLSTNIISSNSDIDSIGEKDPNLQERFTKKIDNFIKTIYSYEGYKIDSTGKLPGIVVYGIECYNNPYDQLDLMPLMPPIRNPRLKYKLWSEIKLQWCNNCEKLISMYFPYSKIYNDSNWKYLIYTHMINDSILMFTSEIPRPREHGYDIWYATYDYKDSLKKTIKSIVLN